MLFYCDSGKAGSFTESVTIKKGERYNSAEDKTNRFLCVPDPLLLITLF